MIEQARELLRNPPSRERVDEALAILGADSSPAASVVRARAYILRGHNLGQGREWLDRAIDEVAAIHEIEAMQMLAIAYAHKGWITKRRDVEMEILAMRPDDPRALASAGWAAWFTGDLERSRELIRRSLALAPEIGMHHFYAGNAALSAGDHGAARSAYERAAELMPRSSSPLAGIAWSYVTSEDREHALAAVRRLGSAEVDEERFWVKLADLEAQLGMPEARAHAERAARSAPESRYRPRGFLPSTVLAAASGDPASLDDSERLDGARLEDGDETYEPRLDLAAVFALRGDRARSDEWLREAERAGWRGPRLASDALLAKPV